MFRTLGGIVGVQDMPTFRAGCGVSVQDKPTFRAGGGVSV